MCDFTTSLAAPRKVVSEGKVVEEGNHSSLMAKGGAYKRLVDAQTGGNNSEGTVDPNSGSGAGGGGVGGGMAANASTESLTELSLKEATLGDIETGVASSTSGKNEGGGGKTKQGDDEKKEAEEDVPNYPFSRIWDIGFKPDLPFLALGTAGAIMAGASYPAWGVMFAKMMAVLFTCEFTGLGRKGDALVLVC